MSRLQQGTIHEPLVPSPDSDSNYAETVIVDDAGALPGIPVGYSNVTIEKNEIKLPMDLEWQEQQTRWMRAQEEHWQQQQQRLKSQEENWQQQQKKLHSQQEAWQQQQQKMNDLEKQIQELQEKSENPLAPWQGYRGNPPPTILVGVKRARTPMAAAIEDFSPVWYTLAMSTGILGIVTSRFPYPFKGLEVAITDIFYAIDILLVVVISAIQLLRFIMFPKAVYLKTRGDPEELALWGCFPIAVLTIASLTATQISNAYWGGHWATIVAVVLWWSASTVMFLIAVFATVSIFRNGLLNDRTFTATVMIPVVGVATAAAEAGFICNYAFDLSARLAVPMLIMGYFYVGLALFTALCFYSIFMHRLFSAGYPAAAKAPGLMMLVGPMGQCATALQTLSSAAYVRMDFAGYNKGTFLTATSAPALATSAILIAMLCLGFAYYWWMVGLVGIFQYAVKRELSYSLMWWATIFPLGTITTAWLELSVEMNSPAFRTLTTGLWLILFIDYLINWGFTLMRSIGGKLLFTRNQEEIKQQLIDEGDVDALEANFRKEMHTPGVVR